MYKPEPGSEMAYFLEQLKDARQAERQKCVEEIRKLNEFLLETAADAMNNVSIDSAAAYRHAADLTKDLAICIEREYV